MGQGTTGAMPTPAVMPSQQMQPFVGRGGPNAFGLQQEQINMQGMPIQQAPLATAPPVDMQANNYTTNMNQLKPAGGAK